MGGKGQYLYWGDNGGMDNRCDGGWGSQVKTGGKTEVTPEQVGEVGSVVTVSGRKKRQEYVKRLSRGGHSDRTVILNLCVCRFHYIPPIKCLKNPICSSAIYNCFIMYELNVKCKCIHVTGFIFYLRALPPLGLHLICHSM